MPYTSTAIVYTIRALGATLDPQTVRHDRADSSHTVSLRPTSMLACYDRVSPHFALLSCWQVQAMVVDSHVHCEDPMEFEARIIPELQRGAVDAAVLFCPVADVYDRHDPGFQDTLQWRTRRREANRRVVALGGEGARVIPYYFVWNDFDVEELARGYRGVKCHRHDD